MGCRDAPSAAQDQRQHTKLCSGRKSSVRRQTWYLNWFAHASGRHRDLRNVALYRTRKRVLALTLYGPQSSPDAGARAHGARITLPAGRRSRARSRKLLTLSATSAIEHKARRVWASVSGREAVTSFTRHGVYGVSRERRGLGKKKRRQIPLLGRPRTDIQTRCQCEGVRIDQPDPRPARSRRFAWGCPRRTAALPQSCQPCPREIGPRPTSAKAIAGSAPEEVVLWRS
jgi:hypothetical protein